MMNPMPLCHKTKGFDRFWTPFLCLNRLLPAFVLVLLLSASGCARSARRIQVLQPLPASGDSGYMAQDYRKAHLIWPLRHHQPRITSPFGEARSQGRWHKGVDLAASPGEGVFAVSSGVAVYSGVMGAYGNLIILRHDSHLETAYAHLQSRYVECNEPVRQGQQIGTVGNTGNSTGPHLHFEVRKNGQPVDPLPLLPGRRD